MAQKILFVGFGRSGKDEAGMFLAEHCGLRYGGSTSWAALPLMAEFLKVHPMVAWENRHKNRELWKAQCDVFRAEDPCRLIRLALVQGDVITGVRGLPEIQAARRANLFDHIIWVANPRVPVDPTVDFGLDECNGVVVNEGTLEEYHRKLAQMAAFAFSAENFSPYALKLL
jgi:hypothetical protein